MTAISLGQAACRSRLSRMAITAGGRLANESGRTVGPAQLRERFEAGNVTSPSQGFASGFVDFLLGRAARHPR